MSYRTIKTRRDGPVSYLQLYRPTANNTINGEMIAECRRWIAECEADTTVLVIEGLPEVFCFGADFQGVRDDIRAGTAGPPESEALYELWEQLTHGSFVTIAHVRGKVNAGGVGFVAACDIVIADTTAKFSLSELLFGIYPACVMPFLARRIGLQRANYMTISTQTVEVEQACAWGLVDAYGPHSELALQRHLLRLRRLSKPSVAHYKQYLSDLTPMLAAAKPLAVKNNHAMQRLPGVIEGIVRYVESGRFPWEKAAV